MSSFQRKMDDITLILQESGIQGALWLGNMNAATNQHLLRNNKIGAILSVCPTSFENHSVQHLVIQADDVDNYDLSVHFTKCMDFIEQARMCTGVLVHCQAGISRSATIVIAYLVRFMTIGVREALEMIEKKRWQVFPNNGFLSQLVRFERDFFSSLESKMNQTRNNLNQTLQLRESRKVIQKPKYEEPMMTQSMVNWNRKMEPYDMKYSYVLDDKRKSINQYLAKVEEKKGEISRMTHSALKDSIALQKQYNQR